MNLHGNLVGKVIIVPIFGRLDHHLTDVFIPGPVVVHGLYQLGHGNFLILENDFLYGRNGVGNICRSHKNDKIVDHGGICPFPHILPSFDAAVQHHGIKRSWKILFIKGPAGVLYGALPFKEKTHLFKISV